MCLWWKCGEGMVLAHYPEPHSSECKTLGTWFGHHQNKNNIWLSMKLSQKKPMGTEVKYSISCRVYDVRESVRLHWVNCSPSDLQFQHTAPKMYTHGVQGSFSWWGKKANTKYSRQLPWCLTALYMIWVTWQSAIPKTHPWVKARHAASESPVEGSWEITYNQDTLICARCFPWRLS